MTFNDTRSPLTLLLSRRSAKARYLAAPGPDAAQLRTILTAAIRVPDHGKLGPWRFIVVPDDRREAFARRLLAAFLTHKADATGQEQADVRQFALQAPSLVVAISSVRASHIPDWEQQLSAGAACQNLLLAAHAMGFAGCWLTTWAAYAPAVDALLGVGAGERIAGFLFLGTADRDLEERPRPACEDVVSLWAG